MLENPKAHEAVEAEGAKVRKREEWCDEIVMENDFCCREAERDGTAIHVADAMTMHPIFRG